MHLAFAVGRESIRQVIPRTAATFDARARAVAEDEEVVDSLITRRLHSIRVAGLEAYETDVDESAALGSSYRARFIPMGESTYALSNAWVRELEWVLQEKDVDIDVISYEEAAEIIEDGEYEERPRGQWRTNDNGGMYDAGVNYLPDCPQGLTLVTHEEIYNAIYLVKVWIKKKS